MNILHTVEYYEPHKGGAEEVIKQLSERLVKKRHRVTIATSYHPLRKSDEINGVKIKQFKMSGNQVKGIRGDRENYRSLLTDPAFDIVFNYAAQTWTTDEMFAILDSVPARKVLAPLGYSRLHHPRYNQYFNKLPDYLRNYDTLVYTSPDYQDKHFGDRHGLEHKSIVIPNGASEQEFEKGDLSFKERFNISSKYLFISVSNHYFAKGHKTVIDAFRAANPDNTALVIIGERPNRHGWYSCFPYCYGMSILNNNIKVFRGLPREMVVAAYREADLFLFGSRVECAPLVMYESFASMTPFITTDVGNVKDHKEVIRIVTSVHEMSREIVNFRRNPDAYRDMAQSAYDLYKKNHTWDVLTDRYENVYRNLLLTSGRLEPKSLD